MENRTQNFAAFRCFFSSVSTTRTTAPFWKQSGKCRI